MLSESVESSRNAPRGKGGVGLSNKVLYLPRLTWPEVKEALPGIKVAIVPVGSTEQHGPHGTFDVDAARAREYCIKLGEMLYPKALVVPCVPYGVSEHHMHFPGTITLKAETFGEILVEIASSLKRHGVRNILFVTGHGGNRPALGIAVNRIRFELGCRAAWLSPTAVAEDVVRANVTSPVTGHACEGEISQCLYLCPECVKTDNLEKGAIHPHVFEKWKKIPVEEAQYWEELTANGALGDATLASRELGQKIIQASLERVSKWIEQFIAQE